MKTTITTMTLGLRHHVMVTCTVATGTRAVSDGPGGEDSHTGLRAVRGAVDRILTVCNVTLSLAIPFI